MANDNIIHGKRFSGDLARFEGADFRETFLFHLYNGEDLAEACGLMRVNPGAYGLYCLKDFDFDKACRKAMGFRVDLQVDRLAHIDHEIEDAMMASVISKNIQWLATKRSRELYGDKLDVNHNVQINIRAAMEDASNRALEHIGHKSLVNNNSSTDNISDALIISDDLEDYDPLS